MPLFTGFLSYTLLVPVWSTLMSADTSVPPTLRVSVPVTVMDSVALRERWWLFFAAIALFAAEWAWRRRQGLP